jgi:hypothetical protein
VEEYHKSVEIRCLVGEEVADQDGEDAVEPRLLLDLRFVKLERLKLTPKMNHFAKRSRIYLKAIQAAYRELQRMRLPDGERSSCVR